MQLIPTLNPYSNRFIQRPMTTNTSFLRSVVRNVEGYNAYASGSLKSDHKMEEMKDDRERGSKATEIKSSMRDDHDRDHKTKDKKSSKKRSSSRESRSRTDRDDKDKKEKHKKRKSSSKSL